MTDPILYHNPRCSKSRAALALLEARGLAVQTVHYLDTPPSETELRALLQALGYRPRQLLRTGEALYQSLGLADPALDDAGLIEALCRHPQLIERPILWVGERAVVGRPTERLLELLP
ncbi:arsenate reductase (glutaredoxin) [Pseudomonas sp. NW5]|uniref:arsenate reductase (glutaredoxin) n=1 Tax=Pseudomonas sp. NW5 TaxID=2934934 RepID=UPI0020204F74|nr:arsenate reductase (glutaredoxin) [Pseudomonas sp. NW5]MCL7461558.1 arsenate reductase (glutaredoxin) [Pseudomonas sp. NW5]